jgi:hypothetical protein
MRKTILRDENFPGIPHPELPGVASLRKLLVFLPGFQKGRDIKAS